MTDESWNLGFVRSLGMRLAGDAIDERDERGERVTGDTLLVLLNADASPIPFILPSLPPRCHWEERVDSANGRQAGPIHFDGGDRFELAPRSVVVMVLQREKRRRQTDVTGAEDLDVRIVARDTAQPASRQGVHDALAPPRR